MYFCISLFRYPFHGLSRIYIHSSYPFSRNIHTLRNPAGLIFMSQAIIFRDIPICYLEFKLDSHLRLNITFYVLDLNYDENSNMNITIQSILHKNSAFVYKGHHSIFSVYPPYSQLNIILFTDWFNLFYVLNMTYIVIEKGLLMSSSTGISTRYDFTRKNDAISLYDIKNLRPNLIYKLGTNLVLTYFICVRKSHFIIFEMSDSVLKKNIVYDGPGFLSPVLKNHKLQTTSSFQCILQIILSSSLYNYSQSFHSMVFPISIMYKVQNEINNVLHFPNKECSRNTCVVFLSTNYGHQVNITVDQFKTSGNFDPSCKYAGLVLAEQFSNSDSDTICKSYGPSYKPSLYSSNSSIFMIFYWYKRYMTANVSLTINSTRCKPVYLYPDYITRVCSRLFRGSTYNKTKCQSYLKDLTKSLGFQLIPTHHSFKLEMVITLTTATCAVLTLVKPYVQYPVHRMWLVSLVLDELDIAGIKGETKQIQYLGISSSSSKGTYCDKESFLVQLPKYPVLNDSYKTISKVISADIIPGNRLEIITLRPKHTVKRKLLGYKLHLSYKYYENHYKSTDFPTDSATVLMLHWNGNSFKNAGIKLSLNVHVSIYKKYGPSPHERCE